MSTRLGSLLVAGAMAAGCAAADDIETPHGDMGTASDAASESATDALAESSDVDTERGDARAPEEGGAGEDASVAVGDADAEIDGSACADPTCAEDATDEEAVRDAAGEEAAAELDARSETDAAELDATQVTDAADLDATFETDAADGGNTADAGGSDGSSAPVAPPTVANVAVTGTSPDNGPLPYNTGTVTVRITGTNLATVSCLAGATGVRLDDLDGADAAVGTAATSCVVVGDGELTATFPAGIRTNGGVGWNVIVTNGAGSNAASDVRFVPRAGLVISEVYTGSPADHEFLELYNPTGTSINTTAVGLYVHIRDSGGADAYKKLTLVTSGTVPAHGFLSLASSKSTDADPWYALRDYTYSDALVGNGGVYVSLSATKDRKVIDKVGWGAQPAGGFEGAAAADVTAGKSIERKPGGGLGHAVDTDDNSADFNAPSSAITPRGTASPPEP